MAKSLVSCFLTHGVVLLRLYPRTDGHPAELDASLRYDTIRDAILTCAEKPT